MSMEYVKRKLIEEFDSEIESMSKEGLGTEEYKSAADSTIKLADRIIKIEEIDEENRQKEIQAMNANELKKAEIDKDKEESRMRNGVTLVLGLCGFAAGIWVHVTGMKYDKDGIIPVNEGSKSVIRQFLRFK